MTDDETPYRVVDGDNQGWRATAAPAGAATIYSADYGADRGLPDASLDELTAARGPLRPVLQVTGTDTAELERLLTQAGRKAITTLAAALETVFHRIREERRTRTDIGDSWDYARRALMAGREGSWESALLMEIVLFGNGLNLAKPTRRLQDVDERRKAGPSSRVDRAARDSMAGMLTRWVTGPGRYTEVAETLAAIVSGYADRHGSDGWQVIADQWLQPGGLAQRDFSSCYRLFYSCSEHFDPALI